MRSRTTLPPDTIALRQLAAGFFITFLLALFAIPIGILCLYHYADPGRFWSWELIMHVLQSLHLGFIGALFLSAGVVWVLDRIHYRKGYHRCRFCDRPFSRPREHCSCPQARELERELRRA